MSEDFEKEKEKNDTNNVLAKENENNGFPVVNPRFKNNQT